MLLLLSFVVAEVSALRSIIAEVPPAVCAPEVVEETCALLSGSDTVNPDDVQQALSATQDSIVRLWAALGLGQAQTVTRATKAGCDVLCSKLAQFIDATMVLPNSSDVACRPNYNGMLCDIDVSPNSVRKLVPVSSKDMPDMHDEEILRNQGRSRPRQSDTLIDLPDPMKVAAARHKSEIEYDLEHAAERLANLFRIFPAAKPECDPDEDCEELADHAIPSLLDVTESCPGYDNDDSHGFRVGQVVSIHKRASRMHGQQAMIACSRLKIGRVCLQQGIRFLGCWHHGHVRLTASWENDLIERNAQAVAYVNEAIRNFRATTLRQVRAKTTWFGAGIFEPRYVKELQRVLNSVVEMLDNVDYVYPGPQCSPNTYAYVYPRAPHNQKDGKFIFYLCDVYMKSPVSEQIETLTHEGSHHATAYTTDICMDADAQYEELDASKYPREFQMASNDRDLALKWKGSYWFVVNLRDDQALMEITDLSGHKQCRRVAYGRSQCAQLASTSTAVALANADNFCYYVQDVLR